MFWRIALGPPGMAREKYSASLCIWPCNCPMAVLIYPLTSPGSSVVLHPETVLILVFAALVLVYVIQLVKRAGQRTSKKQHGILAAYLVDNFSGILISDGFTGEPDAHADLKAAVIYQLQIYVKANSSFADSKKNLERIEFGDKHPSKDYLVLLLEHGRKSILVYLVHRATVNEALRTSLQHVLLEIETRFGDALDSFRAAGDPTVVAEIKEYLNQIVLSS